MEWRQLLRGRLPPLRDLLPCFPGHFGISGRNMDHFIGFIVIFPSTWHFLSSVYNRIRRTRSCPGGKLTAIGNSRTILPNIEFILPESSGTEGQGMSAKKEDQSVREVDKETDPGLWKSLQGRSSSCSFYQGNDQETTFQPVERLPRQNPRWSFHFLSIQ